MNKAYGPKQIQNYVNLQLRPGFYLKIYQKI